MQVCHISVRRALAFRVASDSLIVREMWNAIGFKWLDVTEEYFEIKKNESMCHPFEQPNKTCVWSEFSPEACLLSLKSLGILCPGMFQSYISKKLQYLLHTAPFSLVNFYSTRLMLPLVSTACDFSFWICTKFASPNFSNEALKMQYYLGPVVPGTLVPLLWCLEAMGDAQEAVSWAYVKHASLPLFSLFNPFLLVCKII